MHEKIEQFLNDGLKFIPGNEIQLKLCLIALLLNRNVLIEDVPGMGKTTLVKFFAKTTGLDFHRIQFTSDLLPSDIIGVSLFNKEAESFTFRPGPIFGELILADELNRGSPKTQSALLQAMEEKNVTVDGKTYPLPDRFCLFATQNPRGQFGTYPLPESQLDRFLFKFSMGTLSKVEEIELLRTGTRMDLLDSLERFVDKDQLKLWENKIHDADVTDAIFDYISDVLRATRLENEAYGLSSRAGLDLVDAAKAWAFLEKRDFVLPDDVQAVFPYVAGHRMFSQHMWSTSMESMKAKEALSKVDFVRS